ncbi:SUMF1/EgtB/PvdO family nonheme iron enzyme [Leptolyngbya ohadii]|uniref:SUMF1/EgtB/PvdO family nonheme iron enzyme n=1 Tax=Leptolyngbya ohadii TaxID=1962290 RepID=UPI0019D4889E|nr:SUMF1/EgtB/PvdO family nonheme iron enzyme [Leptolyngbya ohadii]
MKILILSSNPRGDLKLDREIRGLQKVIRESPNIQQLEAEIALAVQVGDLQNLLLLHKPQVVHFCGHGGGEQGLVLEEEDGGERWVQTEALSGLFKLFSKNVGCVLLNACYSEEQANAIVNHIDYVIGMNQAIRDDAAIAFSKGFYLALGYECSVEEAYEFGKNAIQLEISGSSKVLRSAAIEERRAEVEDAVTKVVIPEHLKPVLKRKPTLVLGSDQVISGSSQPLSQAKRQEIQLDVANALVQEDANQQQYCEKVREFLANRILTPAEKFELKQLANQLGISEEQQKEALAKIYSQIEEAKKQYAELVSEYIKGGYYPFTDETKEELKRIQNDLSLLDSEVEEISHPIFEVAEREYQEQLKQRYAQELREAIEPRLKVFEFYVPAEVRRSYRSIEKQVQIKKPGFFGKKIETIRTSQEFGDVTWQEGQAKCFVEEIGNGVTLEMVVIPGGSFTMGAVSDYEVTENSQEVGPWESEDPPHWVTVAPFLMGKYAVTQAQWKAVAEMPKVSRDLDADPSHFKGGRRPVEQVSWHDAVEFCDRLTQKTGRQYRLPSEAEWEYAYRAGTTTTFYCGKIITTDSANYDGSSSYGGAIVGVYREQTTEVGKFSPNAFGLYDMPGNVWEWCLDPWHDNYEGAPSDSSTWITGGRSDFRSKRGGSWRVSSWHCRSTYRSSSKWDERCNDVGFRVVCSVEWIPQPFVLLP